MKTKTVARWDANGTVVALERRGNSLVYSGGGRMGCLAMDNEEEAVRYMERNIVAGAKRIETLRSKPPRFHADRIAFTNPATYAVWQSGTTHIVFRSTDTEEAHAMAINLTRAAEEALA